MTLSSCGRDGGNGRAQVPAVDPAAFPASLVVDRIDDEPTPIATLRASAREGDRVVLHGHIGGRRDPFVNGRAAFTMVDRSLHPCIDDCRTPWDFCCDTQEDIAANAATVQVIDAQGMVIRSAIHGLGGIKPGAEVIVAGVVARRDSPAVLAVNAEQIWVKE